MARHIEGIIPCEVPYARRAVERHAPFWALPESPRSPLATPYENPDRITYPFQEPWRSAARIIWTGGEKVTFVLGYAEAHESEDRPPAFLARRRTPREPAGTGPFSNPQHVTPRAVW